MSDLDPLPDDMAYGIDHVPYTETNVESLFLFPTVITKLRKPVDWKEKEAWFDLYLKHSNEQGKSHDFLGYESIHQEPSVENFFTDTLQKALNQYFASLKLNKDNFDVYVTKAFFNVTTKQSINEHDHAENHLSFVYYPHVPRHLERELVLRTNNYKHPNEPYPQFFASNVEDGKWDALNSLYMNLDVHEGMLYIFPSDMKHNVIRREGDTTQKEVGMKGYKTIEDLMESRFCVAGDMMLIRNHMREYQRMLTPLDNWKKFVDNS